MKIAILALLALPSLYADVLTYTAAPVIFDQPISNHVDFSESLNVPLFDPALGTLDSISYRFGLSGGFSYPVISRFMNTYLTDLNINGSFSFLGISRSNSSTNASGGPPCGPDDPHLQTCPNLSAGASFGFDIVGTVGDMSDYIGSGMAALLFTASADTSIGVTFTDNSLFFGQHNSALNIGDASSAHVAPRLTWTYNYTPGPIVDPPTVTPEPRTSACLVALMGLLVIGRKRLIRGTYSCSETTR